MNEWKMGWLSAGSWQAGQKVGFGVLSWLIKVNMSTVLTLCTRQNPLVILSPHRWLFLCSAVQPGKESGLFSFAVCTPICTEAFVTFLPASTWLQFLLKPTTVWVCTGEPKTKEGSACSLFPSADMGGFWAAGGLNFPSLWKNEDTCFTVCLGSCLVHWAFLHDCVCA